MKDPKGLDVFKRLAEQADVVVENFRPDVKAKLGIDYESLRQINPRLVYGSISGFGQDGPYHKRPGFDQIAQGMGGLMSITGAPGEGPMRVGIPVADLTAGLFCAMGILTALLERDVSGEGQWVQTSLFRRRSSCWISRPRGSDPRSLRALRVEAERSGARLKAGSLAGTVVETQIRGSYRSLTVWLWRSEDQSAENGAHPHAAK